MPLHDGRWLHEDQRLPPLLQHSPQHDPDHAVAVLDLEAYHGSLEHRELMTESGVLEEELGAILYGEIQDADARCGARRPAMVLPGLLDLRTESR